MDVDWRISHCFRVPMEYVSGPINYPALNATLVLDSVGRKISRVDHKLIAEESLPCWKIGDISMNQLAILWDLISYVSSYPAWSTDRRVRRVGTAYAPSPLSTAALTH